MADDDAFDWFFDGLADLDLMDDPKLVAKLEEVLPEGAEYGWLLYWHSRFDVAIERLPLLDLGLFGHTKGWNAVYLPPNIDRSLLAEAVIEAADVAPLSRSSTLRRSTDAWLRTCRVASSLVAARGGRFP